MATEVYATEAEAIEAAKAIEASDWNQEIDQYRYYAYYSASREGWIVRIRPFMPGVCT